MGKCLGFGLGLVQKIDATFQLKSHILWPKVHSNRAGCTWPCLEPLSSTALSQSVSSFCSKMRLTYSKLTKISNCPYSLKRADE